MHAMLRAALAALAALAAMFPFHATACSSCGCNAGTEWFAGTEARGPGLALDLRYDFVNQNQLRLGRSPVPTAGLTTGDIGNEIQKGTLTHFYTLGADYVFGPHWGLNLQVPIPVRLHETVAEGDDPSISATDDRGVGDVRLVGRYQETFGRHAVGLQFGVKLPTGGFHKTFDSGPQTGEPLDRGLQLGSGTTDLILGVYDIGALGTRLDRFEQVQYRVALDSREEYRPSPQAFVNLGLRYRRWLAFVPQLQLNFRWEGREIGAQSDYANSGSRTLYLTPGATWSLDAHWHAYGFAQWPLYQDYTGFQLAPRYILSAGLNYRF
jgi:hypothetical protein